MRPVWETRNLKTKVALALKRLLSPLLYRHVPSSLQPERLYFYLHQIWSLRYVPGAVLEVGCAIGGTALLGHAMLGNTGQEKTYICMDTFGGFPPEQFEADRRTGLSERHRAAFAASSLTLVRSVLDSHGGREIQLVQGDVATLPDTAFPGRISLCLLDVDLVEPTYVGLKRIYPRLAPGGVILVDDCGQFADHDSWRARIGYQRFCREMGLPEEYSFDMGIVRMPERSA